MKIYHYTDLNGLKGIIVDHLIASGHEVVDFGPGEGEQPEYSASYARKVLR